MKHVDRGDGPFAASRLVPLQSRSPVLRKHIYTSDTREMADPELAAARVRFVKYI
jgi:hypothetical protein